MLISVKPSFCNSAIINRNVDRSIIFSIDGTYSGSITPGFRVSYKVYHKKKKLARLISEPSQFVVWREGLAEEIIRRLPRQLP